MTKPKLNKTMVEDIRRQRGFSAVELQKILGMRSRQAYYVMLANGSLKHVKLLAKIFGVDPKDLIEI